MFWRGTKVLQVWNDTRVINNRIFIFGWTIPIKYIFNDKFRFSWISSLLYFIYRLFGASFTKRQISTTGSNESINQSINQSIKGLCIHSTAQKCGIIKIFFNERWLLCSLRLHFEKSKIQQNMYKTCADIKHRCAMAIPRSNPDSRTFPETAPPHLSPTVSSNLSYYNKGKIPKINYYSVLFSV